MGSPSHFLEKKRVLGFEKALPKRAPPLGGGAPPSPSRFCQLSAIKADYWPTLAPRPAPRAARRESVPPSVRPAQGTGDVSPSPRMLSDFQSEPIRAIGGRLKIGGHPAPPIVRVRRSGGMANNRRSRLSEGTSLRSSAPSVVRLGEEFARGRRFPDSGNHLPRPSIGLGGRLERELGEDDSGRVPPRVVFRRFPSLFAAHRRFRR